MSYAKLNGEIYQLDMFDRLGNKLRIKDSPSVSYRRRSD